MDSIIHNLRFLIQQEVSENNLLELPLFSDLPVAEEDRHLLHPSYFPKVEIMDLTLNTRGIKLMKRMGIKSIGQLLLTPYSHLLKQRNCGENTVDLVQEAVRDYVLFKQIDYKQQWFDMETMLKSSLSIKERNFQILAARFGLKRDNILTLEECGKEFGLTREAVRQVINKAFDTIRHPATDSKLHPFWQTVNEHLKKKEIIT
jgi:hypothetical protein